MPVDRRTLIKSGGVAFGALALAAVASGTTIDQATAAVPPARHTPLPNPATTPVPNPPFPHHLTRGERAHLVTFDELDFVIFSGAMWNRMGESHAENIRVHWPDGHFADGLDQHVTDLEALFAWAPDTHIHSHPLRLATDGLTCVTGVMAGTFTQPMPDGKGRFIQPTGKAYSINMATVGIWNRKGTMDEEFLFWDNQTFFSEIGVS